MSASAFFPHLHVQTGMYTEGCREKAHKIIESLNSVVSTTAAIEASLFLEQAEKEIALKKSEELRAALEERVAERDELSLQNHALATKLDLETEAKKRVEADLVSCRREFALFKELMEEISCEMAELRAQLALQGGKPSRASVLPVSEGDFELGEEMDSTECGMMGNKQSYALPLSSIGAVPEGKCDVRAGTNSSECSDGEAETSDCTGTLTSSTETEVGEQEGSSMPDTGDEAVKVGPWQLNEILGEGSFAEVWGAVHESTGQVVAVKFVQRPSTECFSYLEHEKTILDAIWITAKVCGEEPCVPQVFEHGFCGDGQTEYLVMERLGPDLFDLVLAAEEKSNARRILQYAHDSVTCLEQVHAAGFVHRDLKPENFMAGLGDESKLFLGDFGLSLSRSDVNMEPYSLRDRDSFVGTKIYASNLALRNHAQIRIDDLEALNYVLLALLRKGLPWADRPDDVDYILQKRRQCPVDTLCREVPAIAEYFAYVKSLRPWDEPDYDRMRKIFKDGLTELSAEQTSTSAGHSHCVRSASA